MSKMHKFELLPRSFYAPSAQSVAVNLLGHWLIRKTEVGFCGGPIVETEAYLRDDPACHGAPGPTPRNRVLFGPPGHAYIYLIYGYHFCANAVCMPRGIAEAVLIRAIEPLFDPEAMRLRRPVTRLQDLTNGPAKLCQALDLDRTLDGVDLTKPGSALFIARNPTAARFRHLNGPVMTTTRIGITRAAHLPLRFYLQASPFVSRRSAAAKANPAISSD